MSANKWKPIVTGRISISSGRVFQIVWRLRLRSNYELSLPAHQSSRDLSVKKLLTPFSCINYKKDEPEHPRVKSRIRIPVILPSIQNLPAKSINESGLPHILFNGQKLNAKRNFVSTQLNGRIWWKLSQMWISKSSFFKYRTATGQSTLSAVLINDSNWTQSELIWNAFWNDKFSTSFTCTFSTFLSNILQVNATGSYVDQS